jgi:hypothetical protein
MRLCFLMEREYAPYPKWFGTAFQQLSCAASLAPVLQQALSAGRWQEREEQLCAAYEYLAAWHNELGITEMLADKATRFFGRPFRVIQGEKFSRALCACVTDPAVRRWFQLPLIGCIDQVSDNTDLLSDPRRRIALRDLWLTGGR